MGMDRLKQSHGRITFPGEDHGGFALSSGNPIPHDVHAEGYQAMIHAPRETRGDYR